MMKINFKKLFIPSLIFSGAVTLLGILFLLIFSGGTFASYTMQNLRLSLFVKALVSAILVFALTLVYFAIRFKKKGVFLSVYAGLSAVINAVTGFALCVICRAPLGEYTFALMLYAVAMTYIAALFFANNYTVKTAKSKKTEEPVQDSFQITASLTFKSLVYIIAVICVVIIAAFAASFVFAVTVVPMYALPAILVTVLSVVQTIAVGCRLYASKV